VLSDKKPIGCLPAIRLRFDVWLLLSVAALLVFGLMMVYDTTFDLGLLVQDNPLHYFQRQLVAAALGDHRLCVRHDAVRLPCLRRFSVLIMLVTLALLTFLLFFGESNFGATRGLARKLLSAFRDWPSWQPFCTSPTGFLPKGNESKI
jgi:cell division protein FtsW (lipid II flippase)